MRMELAPEPVWCSIDYSRLQQVLVNLTVNAEQAMSELDGRRKLTIRTSVTGDRAQISVIDSGPGIPPDVQARIFEPFFTTKGPGSGTGLGLSICYGIVRDHGGTIWVDSRPGHGAAFHVQLPIAPAGDRVPPHGEAAAAMPALHETDVRVLIADDEDAIRLSLAHVLRQKGCRVDAVADGQAGLEAATSADYDVIVCDMRMPGVSGIQMYEQLVQMKSPAAERIVFTTGEDVDQATYRRLVSAGVPVMQKPFTTPDLLAAIDAVVKR